VATAVEGRVVVDLLPQEHAAALDLAVVAEGAHELVRVRFVERSGKVAGHDAKAAKGLLARHLLLSRAAPLKALATWEHDRFDLDLDLA